MNFRPLADFILVRPIERKHSQTIAVISHEKHARGIVLAVGPGKRDKRGNIKPLDAKPGDIVHFGDGTRTLDQCYAKIVDGHEVLRVIQEADIAYIEEKEQPVSLRREDYPALADKLNAAMEQHFARQEKTAA